VEPVRRKEVFLVQPTSPPVNDHVVELLALADATQPRLRVASIAPLVAGALRRFMTDGSLEDLS
jgi:ribose-phosphate pyrophosphokinase